MSFTVPTRITVYDHTTEWELEKGNQVTTDFVTYSSRNMYRSTRAVVITVNDREHCENWDTIAGPLPQFNSLRNSGINTAPKEPPKKPTITDAIKNLFKPI